MVRFAQGYDATKLKSSMPVRPIVVTLSGRELQVEVQEPVVGSIKQEIARLEGIPPEQQRLVFGGKHLEDEQTLAEVGIVDGSRVHLILSLKGGVLRMD